MDLKDPLIQMDAFIVTCVCREDTRDDEMRECKLYLLSLVCLLAVELMSL